MDRVRVNVTAPTGHKYAHIAKRYEYAPGEIAMLFTKLTGVVGAPAADERLLVGEKGLYVGLLAQDELSMVNAKGETLTVTSVEVIS